MKAGLGRSRVALYNCQYGGESCEEGKTDVEGDEAGAAAVATVVCDLVSEGAFLTAAIAAADGEVVKDRLEACLRRRAPLAGFVRSILER